MESEIDWNGEIEKDPKLYSKVQDASSDLIDNLKYSIFNGESRESMIATLLEDVEFLEKILKPLKEKILKQ